MAESSLLAYALDLASFLKCWEEIKDKPVSKMTYVDLESVSKEDIQRMIKNTLLLSLVKKIHLLEKIFEMDLKQEYIIQVNLYL